LRGFGAEWRGQRKFLVERLPACLAFARVRRIRCLHVNGDAGARERREARRRGAEVVRRNAGRRRARRRTTTTASWLVQAGEGVRGMILADRSRVWKRTRLLRFFSRRSTAPAVDCVQCCGTPWTTQVSCGEGGVGYCREKARRLRYVHVNDSSATGEQREARRRPRITEGASPTNPTPPTRSSTPPWLHGEGARRSTSRADRSRAARAARLRRILMP
jgi:hypothetical protein